MENRVVKYIGRQTLRPDEWLRLVWGFFWRALSVTVLAAATAGAVGFVIGLLIGLVMVGIGLDVNEYGLMLNVIGGLIGLLIGFCTYYIYIRWLLKSKMGPFRLQLVRCESPDAGNGIEP